MCDLCCSLSGVEVCTGPLGQGISQAVGLAIAQKHMATTYHTEDFPTLLDHSTYVICGDGCLQEGVASEASSLAGHLGLGRLIVLYDDNKITIDGPTDLSFTEDVGKRYEAYGWHVQTVDDVAHGLEDLREAVRKAQAVTDQPSLIKIRTAIGYGSPSKEGSEKAHGSPLGPEDLAGAKSNYGLDPTKSFFVDDDVKEVYAQATARVEAKHTEWQATFDKYKAAHPAKAAELERRFGHELPDGIFDKLPTFAYGQDKELATRKYSEQCINALAPELPELMGGSADLTPSNLTSLKCSGDFQKDTPGGRYLRFGVREHGMTAVCNGIFAYGAFRPFCATFLTFAGYCVGAIRISALSRFGVLFVMTHDSIGLGEDGPTHQPIETLESLRSMPNIHVFRPADLNETAAAYQSAMTNHTTPTVICCSRSTVPALQLSTKEKALRGAYACVECDGEPQLVLVATGSEVGPCVAAAQALEGVRVRVVSMPCQEIFLDQTKEYQESVLPGNVPTLSVEASATYGWHRFSHAQIGMTSFGKSGKGSEVFEYFGFGVDNIVAQAKVVLDFYKDKPVPNLSAVPTIVPPNDPNHH